MKYELAKQLKDAGFSQEVKSGFLMMGSVVVWSPGEGSLPLNHKETCIYIPTLEELIKACGDDLKMVGKQPRKNYWYATSLGVKKIKKQGDGSTPSEAVAHLYLALKKND